MAYRAITLTTTGDITQDSGDDLQFYVDKLQGLTLDLSGATDNQVLGVSNSGTEVVAIDSPGDPASIKVSRTAVTTASYTIQLTDSLIGVNYAGAVTLTLPAATTDYAILVKDESGSAKGANKITIVTPGSETIDGASDYVINSSYQFIGFYSDGSDWFIM